MTDGTTCTMMSDEADLSEVSSAQRLLLHVCRPIMRASVTAGSMSTVYIVYVLVPIVMDLTALP